MLEKERLSIVAERVRGKNVLDVGCVDHESAKAGQSDWLHRVVLDHAANVLGLDYAEDEVIELNRMGYNVVYGNAEDVSLGKTFDVVVAGELIEHLSNPGNFLVNMYDHLNEGGEIVLSTPNPFYPKRLLEILANGKACVHPQHSSWFCPITLKEIMSRAGFRDIEILYINNSERWSWLVNRLTKFRPWYCTNLIAVGKKY